MYGSFFNTTTKSWAKKQLGNNGFQAQQQGCSSQDNTEQHADDAWDDWPEQPLLAPQPNNNQYQAEKMVSSSHPKQRQQQQQEGKATIFSCVVNLANTIVGAGMLGLPGAFGGTGYLGGTILIWTGAFFSAHGLVLLSKAAQQVGLPSSFYAVARVALPQYTILIDLAVAMKCFGVATGYLITVGDCMVDALDHLLLNNNGDHDGSWWIAMVLSRQFWIVGALLAVLPVSFFRTLDELKKASALALIFVFFLATGIVAYANGWADPCRDNKQEPCQGDFVPFTNVPSTVAKLPIFVFAFTCHQNIFPVVNELQHRTQTRLNTIVFLAVGLALTLFFVVALDGYKTFGSNVRGDILLNYPETANVTVLRICIAVMLTLHYPLQLDPSRRCIMSLVHHVGQQQWNGRKKKMYLVDRHRNSGVKASSKAEDLTEHSETSVASVYLTTDMDENNETHRTNRSRSIILHDDAVVYNEDDTLFYAITFSFLLSSFAIAMIVDDLGVVLAVVGATGSTLVSYVLPGLIYVQIYPYMDASKIGAYLQLFLGCLIMPLALYFVVTGKFKH